MIPGPNPLLGGDVLPEVAARYFFLPSPALRPFVGMLVPGVRGAGPAVCDKYGDVLTASHFNSSTWSAHHDGNVKMTLQGARDCGIRGGDEVKGLFRASLPLEARRRMELDSTRQHGYIPDLRLYLPLEGHLRATLLEVKTLRCTASTYPARVREQNSRRATDARAAGLQKEYDTSLKHKDAAWCDTPEGEVGPMRAAFRSYGRLHGLVFGQVGEVSADVEKLIGVLARAGVEQQARAMHARTTQAAIGRLVWYLRRQLSSTNWRGLADVLLDRRAMLEEGDNRPAARSSRGPAWNGSCRRPTPPVEPVIPGGAAGGAAGPGRARVCRCSSSRHLSLSECSGCRAVLAYPPTIALHTLSAH
jgi:hypothetical protein